MLGGMFRGGGVFKVWGRVRLKVSKLMAQRGITAYALCKGSHLSYPSAYRLSRAGGLFGRLHTDTLDTLCEFFQVQPGVLIEWVPAKRN